MPCYIPSRRILAEGGYEAEDSLWYYDRPARLSNNVEDLIIRTVTELVPAGYRSGVKKADPAHEHFDVRFAFVSKTRELVHSEEVADLRWVPLNAVEQMGTDESVLRAVAKLRALDATR